MYIRVAVNIPADKTFSYVVPGSMRERALTGKRVSVPFGRREATGYILETNISAEVDNIKEVIEIPDEEPLFGEEELEFYRWISRYYLYPLGKTLFEILPGGGGRCSVKKEVVVSLIPNFSHSFPMEMKLTGQQRRIVDFLSKNGGTSLSVLRKTFGRASYLASSLEQKGVVCLTEKEVYRVPANSPYSGIIENPIVLNSGQMEALAEIRQGLESQSFSPYLFHGVTGSGKTEVYLKAMEETRKKGGGAIFLVPEIGLTPQLISRLGDRFGLQNIAVMHSGIPMAVRYDQWRRIQRGEVKIVIGARSALYVPVKNLRLIIVDEEHADAYKQDDHLCYNSRDMAVVRAKLSKTTVVLGTATPAVQTYFNVQKKKYRYLNLSQRVENRTLPRFEIVDMKAEKERSAETPILSRALREAIFDTLAAKRQALLFLNRRGFDTVVLCPDCGHVFKCRNCAVALTHHAAYGQLKCHRCDFTLRAFPACPECRGKRIRSYGLGTEKLEEEIKNLFTEARVGRMDSDTTARPGDAARILMALRRQEIDILVGTQMITKGHDYPGITLVGVICADLSLNVPDFRASETTFQMLIQVAGRGGRGDTPGRVIVQTFNPGNYAIKRAQEHDYFGFFEDEIRQRKELGYPPFTRLVNLHLSGIRKEEGLSGIESIREILKSVCTGPKLQGKVEILGPAEAPIFKVRGRYRWQLLLKGNDLQAQSAVVEAVRVKAAKAGLTVKVDVDPMNFM